MVSKKIEAQVSKIKTVIMLFLLCLVLIGCDGRVLLENISQKQSLEIVNYLATNGIEVYPEKASGSRDNYLIKVGGADYFDAVALLERAQLPKSQKQSADELLSSGGIFPQSREIEQLKLERIYASEIEELVAKHKGVKQAEAVVRLSSNTNPIAAVNLHLKISPSEPVQVSRVVDSILKIVPGVSKDKISVSTDEIVNTDSVSANDKMESFLGFAKVSADDRRGLALAFTLCLLLFAAGGGIMGYYVGVLRSSTDITKESSTSSRGNSQSVGGVDDILPKLGGVD